MTQISIPIFTLILGVFAGFVSSLFLANLRYRQQLLSKLIDRYIAARREVSDTLTPYTTIQRGKQWKESELSQARKEVANLFYTHYDVFPVEVLDSLVTLEACLHAPDTAPYVIKDKCLQKLPKSEISSFVAQTSLYENTRAFSELALASNDPQIRGNEAIKRHARHVVFCMNKYSTIQQVMKIPQYSRKYLSGARSKKTAFNHPKYWV